MTGLEDQEDGCAVRSAANARRGSSTRATSTTRRRSGAGANAPPAPPASRPTSGSRRPGSSSSSATGRARSSTATSSPSGLRKALTRRPVPDGAAEQAADEIEAELRAAGVERGPVVADRRAGDGEALRGIDQIAYIRFASVYQSFEDLEDLKREVDTPLRDRASGAADERPVGPRHPGRDRGRRGPDRPVRPGDLQPSSVDLHLDRSFRVFRNNRYPYIDVRAPQPDLTELLRIEDDEPFILHPGEFVLGQTLEWVELPDDLVARLEGKSSRSAGSGCSSTRPRATSIRAGRAT